MSLLGIMGSGSHFYRLSCSGALNAAKILAANPGQISSNSPLSSSQTGRIFTAKYLHTLQQQKKDGVNVNALVAAAASSQSLIPKGRAMSSTGDHVKLWTAERVLSAGLVPLIPMALIMPCAPLDYLVAFGLTVHSHWGIEAIVHDYVRASIFGETIPKIAVALVYGLSVMTLGGLFYFIYADVGLGQAVRLLWKL